MRPKDKQLVNDLWDRWTCNECNLRNTCESLCPLAELYADQDNVDVVELLQTSPSLGSRPTDVDMDMYNKRKRIISIFKALPRDQQVSRLLKAGLSRKEIAQLLNITRENLRQIIRRLRKCHENQVK